ncbi:hypothetical protein QE152_g19004 [Popillia japonica]|uniref:Uncharacterized protein n=1 Tax=Popillia japonica TaxID=7064 RepID=A0AAW1L4R6_POPJA
MMCKVVEKGARLRKQNDVQGGRERGAPGKKISAPKNYQASQKNPRKQNDVQGGRERGAPGKKISAPSFSKESSEAE